MLKLSCTQPTKNNYVDQKFIWLLLLKKMNKQKNIVYLRSIFISIFDILLSISQYLG